MANRSADGKTSNIYPDLYDDGDDKQFNGEEYGNEFLKDDEEQYRGEEEYRITNRKYKSHQASYHSGLNISASSSETDNEEKAQNSSFGRARSGSNESQIFERNWFQRVIEELLNERLTLVIIGLVALVAIFLILFFVLRSPVENQTGEFDFSIFRTSVTQLKQKFKKQVIDYFSDILCRSLLYIVYPIMYLTTSTIIDCTVAVLNHYRPTISLGIFRILQQSLSISALSDPIFYCRINFYGE